MIHARSRRFPLGFARPIMIAAALLGASCSREGGRPLVETQPRVLTTISAVQSWTAFLLQDIEEPHLLTAREVDAVLEAETLPSTGPIPEASLLIAFDGTVDGRAVEAFNEYPPPQGGTRTLLRVASDGAETYRWLDPREAVGHVSSLSIQLQERFPDKASAIAANEARLRAEIEALAPRMKQRVAAWEGEMLLTDSPAIEPMLSFLGIEGTNLLEDIDGASALTAAQRKLVAERAEASRLRLLASGNIDENPALASEAARLKLRMVGIDPLIEGSMGPDHYVTRMEHNAQMLSLGLATAESEQP